MTGLERKHLELYMSKAKTNIMVQLSDFKKGQQFLFQQAQHIEQLAYQLHVGILFSYHLQYNKT